MPMNSFAKGLKAQMDEGKKINLRSYAECEINLANHDYKERMSDPDAKDSLTIALNHLVKSNCKGEAVKERVIDYLGFFVKEYHGEKKEMNQELERVVNLNLAQGAELRKARETILKLQLEINDLRTKVLEW
ncbi:MAG: hypothetical protein Hyperionvirus10_62 [Hyperionvirus sp.]|uniref:Uncharacterized protein n=1 Tax=Hyperionvirus sp. TaxID=2487770 RepID=A0A3G5A8X3_9VIRU|nr:MAG: hypothetical protein Hyperionvirus10_62 [Hyperionvirus sp.]